MGLPRFVILLIEMKRAFRNTAILVGVFGGASHAARINLEKDWSIQSSAKVHEKGDVISTSGFQPSNWYRSAVPSTVVNALVENKVYPDPYFGMNLRSIPGTSYRI